jgi:hypothetical protein
MPIQYISEDEIEILSGTIEALGATSKAGDVLTTIKVEGKGYMQQWLPYTYPVGKAVTIEIIDSETEYPTIMVHGS